jgi:hypothetical protein
MILFLNNTLNLVINEVSSSSMDLEIGILSNFMILPIPKERLSLNNTKLSKLNFSPWQYKLKHLENLVSNELPQKGHIYLDILLVVTIQF